MPLVTPVVTLDFVAQKSSVVNRTTVPVPADITQPQMLAGANASRQGLTIWNDSTGNVLIELGGTPTLTAYTVRIASGGYYELPYPYMGEVYGLWDAAGGNGAFVREFI